MSGMTHIRRALIRNLTAAGALALGMYAALALDVVTGYVVMGVHYVMP